MAPTPETKQELCVWLWYPAVPTPSKPNSDYLPIYWRRALRARQGFVVSTIFSRDLTRVRAHSLSDATISPAQPKYPVIILRAGGGALSTDYTSIAEDLASHGYVVVSFDAPYRTVLTAFPDGRVVLRPASADFERLSPLEREHLANQVMNAWIADVKFALDKLQQLNVGDPTGRFVGKLDMQKVGIVGHSLGGATAAQFCHDDARCKAGIDIDGMPFGSVIQEGLHRPFFFIMSDHSKEKGQEAIGVRNNIESIFDKLPMGERWQVTIIGANHFSFSDQMLTRNAIAMGLLRKLHVLGSLDKYRGLRITSDYIHTFFDVYLKGIPVEELNHLSTVYPEVKSGIDDAFPKEH